MKKTQNSYNSASYKKYNTKTTLCQVYNPACYYKLLYILKRKLQQIKSLIGSEKRSDLCFSVTGQRSTLKADTIVLAVGLKPESKLLETLKDKMPEVYAIGDCVEPRKVMDAVRKGFRIARIV